MTCVDYDPKTMKIVYYKNGEIEIVKGKFPDRSWLFHFRNVYQFADAIKTARPELAKELIEILQVK